MASFVYTARDPSGRGLSGVIEAENLDEGIAVLQARTLVVTSLAPLEQARTTVRRRRQFHARVTTGDRSVLCRQLAILLEAGVPLVRALTIMGQQIESRPLWVVMERVRAEVEMGLTLHEALAKHPKVFSQLWVALVEVGESSGHLPEAFAHLAKHLERAAALQGKAVSAMVYPAILLVGIIGALVVFLTFVIPQFASMYQNFGSELPALTRFTLGASQFFRQHLAWIGLGTIGLVFGMRWWLGTPPGKRLADAALLRLPPFGILFHQLNLTQFLRGLATLLASGVPILYAMEIIEKSSASYTYQQALRELKERVKGGKPLSEPMQWNALFPPLVVSMASVGEEIGELPKMLNRLADYYEANVETFVERLSSIIEPIAICVMGAVVGTMVAAMFLPIFKMSETIK